MISGRSICSALISFPLLIAVSADLAALDAEQVFERAAASVVTVESQDAVGITMGLGSGVVIAPGEIITNCHVVRAGLILQVKKEGRSSAAKRRGQVLGNPNGADALRRANKGNRASLKAIKAKADQHAEDLRPVIEALEEDGITSLGAIAEALNERGMLTPRGAQWYKTSVGNLLARLQA